MFFAGLVVNQAKSFYIVYKYDRQSKLIEN